MGTTPTYASIPRTEQVRVAAANTARDGTGTIPTLIIGAANGTRISSIVAKAEVTTTAQMARLFLSVDNGVTWRLYDELEIPAITASASISSSRVSRNYTDLVLANANHRLGVTLQVNEAHVFVAHGADL